MRQSTFNIQTILAIATFFSIAVSSAQAGVIHDSVEADDPDKVAELASSGLDVNEKDASDMTALQLATRWDHPGIVEILLEHGANPNIPVTNARLTPLHVAARKGNLEMVKLLIDHGADIEAATWQGTSPMHYAARAGHTEVVELLIERGADVDIQDNEDFTPLHNTTHNGYMELTKLLLANGADPEATTYSGYTPVLCAFEKDHQDIVDLLNEAIASRQ